MQDCTDPPESCDRHVRKTAIADRLSAAKNELGANSLAGGKRRKQGARSKGATATPPSRMAA